MQRPRVILRCVADRYADRQRERIIEFTDGASGSGGLISFFRQDDGTLRVDVYRIDQDVLVQAPKQNLRPNPQLTKKGR